MVETLKVIVSYRNARYMLEINDKITRIIGDSGTGKTTLSSLSSGLKKKAAKTKVIGLPDYDVISVTTVENLKEFIEKSERKVVIIDEQYRDAVCQHAVEKAIQENKSCYFVLIGRGRYAGLNIDIDSIYELDISDGVNVMKHALSKPTLQGGRSTNFTHCLIEDTGKGFE